MALRVTVGPGSIDYTQDIIFAAVFITIFLGVSR
jgi:hypothetical protein